MGRGQDTRYIQDKDMAKERIGLRADYMKQHSLNTGIAQNGRERYNPYPNVLEHFFKEIDIFYLNLVYKSFSNSVLSQMSQIHLKWYCINVLVWSHPDLSPAGGGCRCQRVWGA